MLCLRIPLAARLPAFIVAVGLLLAAPGANANEADEAYLELMEAAGITKVFGELTSSIQQLLMPLLRRANPNVSEENLDIVMNEFSAMMNEELPSLIIDMAPMYKAAFTPEEMRELARFYRTPLGQKTVTVLPALIQQGAVVGQQWSQKITPKVLQRVQRKLAKSGIHIEI